MTAPGRPRPLLVAVSLATWLAGIPLAHGAIPWAISRLGARHGGSSDGSAGPWNTLGLLPLVAGAAVLLWVMAAHFARAGEWTSLELTPRYVLDRGPYAYSRNPMYVGECALWIGWAIWFGSVPVAVAVALLCVAMNRAIRREERTLETRFGTSYTAYRARVPRWLGLSRR